MTKNKWWDREETDSWEKFSNKSPELHWTAGLNSCPWEAYTFYNDACIFLNLSEHNHDKDKEVLNCILSKKVYTQITMRSVTIL